MIRNHDLSVLVNYLRTGPLAISPEVTIFLQDPRVAKLEKFKLSSAGKVLMFHIYMILTFKYLETLFQARCFRTCTVY